MNEEELLRVQGFVVHKEGKLFNKVHAEKKRSKDAKGRSPKKQRTSKLSDESMDLYEKSVKHLEHELQNLQVEEFSKTFGDIVDFINRAHKRSEFKGLESSAIPTAVLLKGINVADHKPAFDCLQKLLKESITKYVAVVPTLSAYKVKVLFQLIITKFMESSKMVNSNYEVDEDSNTVDIAKSGLALFSAWFNSKRAENKRQPLVVILEDVDGIPKKVLHDFITLCSEYKNDIPWVLIFGIPTTIRSISEFLPQNLMSCLAVEKFQFTSYFHLWNLLVEKILANKNIPLKLGWKTYRLLEELFHDHDFSISLFQYRYKFCMFEHFNSNVTNLLCCPEKQLKQCIDGFDHNQLEKFRQLRSFMRYVESQSKQTMRSILQDDKFFKKLLLKLLKQHHMYQQNTFPLVHCLHHLLQNLPNQNFAKKVDDLYAHVLEVSLNTKPEFSEAFVLLRMESRDEIIDKLRYCVRYLKNQQNNETISLFLSTFNECIEKLSTKGFEMEVDNTVEELELASTSRTEFLEKLRTNAKQNPKPKLFEDSERFDVAERLEKLFGTYLVSPTTLPFHEIFYFDNYTLARDRLNPSPRASLHRALANPHHYLKCSCCKISTPSDIVKTMPDVCIVYKLHLECGTYINVYDWLQRFNAVVSKTPNDEDDESVSEDVQFAQAVKELQYIGFIGPCKQKVDHVMRLTWGESF